MARNINGISSTLEWKEKNETISSKKELVNSLWMNIAEISENAKKLYKKLKILDGSEKPSENAFVNAYIWFVWLKPKNRNYLTVVDFFPNNKPWGLFYIINIRTNTVEYSNQVGHWAGSRGKNDSPSGSPDSYSNELGSKQSSLWFFMTSEKIAPWSLHIREWLRLTWLEKGINDNAIKRALYIHPAGLDQSDWCFTLQYDKAEWQEWEDKILKQLYKIKDNSIVFSYDSRVFDEYKEQSALFSENPNENSRLYVVGDNTDEVERRVRSNQESGKDNIFMRGINSIWRRMPFVRNIYENISEKNRECWWKKKEIEMIAAQIVKEICGMKIEDKEKNLENLVDDVNKVRLWFKEEFYRSEEKIRREKIDKWVSEFRKTIKNLLREKGNLAELEKFCDSKKSEYNAWESKASKNQRKISEDERAEIKFAA